MKTDDLIDILAKDSVSETQRSFWAYFLVGVLILLAYTAYLFFSTGMGVRPLYSQAILNPLVAFKQLLPLFLGLTILPYIRSLSYPVAKRPARFSVPLGIYVLFMVALFVWGWIETPAGDRELAFLGQTHMKCLFTIPVYSWVICAFVIIALKNRASVHPRVLAMMAALISACAATVVYAFGCTEDSPLFYAVWYNAAIFLAAGIGGLVGAYFLKW